MTASPLRGRYLVRNRVWNAWLQSSDAVLALLAPSRETAPAAAPRRLLLAVGGHLGDAVIATCVLEPLRAAWPGVEIGVVTGSWNRPVFDGHDAIRWVHYADHWKLDRVRDGWLARASRSAASRRAAVQDIARVGYDTAVDLYPYYPNAASLLRRARIPRRLGYTSGGGGAHYTRALDWTPGRAADDHLRLLDLLGVQRGSELSYRLPPVGDVARSRTRERLTSAGVAGEYVVLHVGAGAPTKRWPTEGWVALARSLKLPVVLTGAGRSDRALVDDVRRDVPDAVDLCDALDWAGFRAVLCGARVVVSVDTVAAHLAAGAGVPTIVLATGIDDPARWQPIGPRVTQLTERVPCMPCHESAGCDEMTCIRTISADRVIEAVRRHTA